MDQFLTIFAFVECLWMSVDWFCVRMVSAFLMIAYFTYFTTLYDATFMIHLSQNSLPFETSNIIQSQRIQLLTRLELNWSKESGKLFSFCCGVSRDVFVKMPRSAVNPINMISSYGRRPFRIRLPLMNRTFVSCIGFLRHISDSPDSITAVAHCQHHFNAGSGCMRS